MSRLDSFIRRVTAQRDCLNHIAGLIADIDGPVFELGLGNGRTYDHLREKLPDRRIVAFDRQLAAHRFSTPAPDDLVLGEIHETARPFVGMNAALVHADIGTGLPGEDDETIAWLSALAADLLRPAGIAASGLPLRHPRLQNIRLPSTVHPDRYFLYQRD
jgi:hypothetical protein